MMLILIIIINGCLLLTFNVIGILLLVNLKRLRKDTQVKITSPNLYSQIKEL